MVCSYEHHIQRYIYYSCLCPDENHSIALESDCYGYDPALDEQTLMSWCGVQGLKSRRSKRLEA